MMHCSMKVHISSAYVEKKHDLFVISESSITYIVLYSIYLSVLFSCLFLFYEALK